MKKKILLFLSLSTFALNAQLWNNTYDINGNDDNLVPSFVIPSFDLGSIAVSWGENSTGPVDYFILTKHDMMGNTVYNERFEPFSLSSRLTDVKALLETRDRGVLVAGYYQRGTIMSPFLMKVDVNGVLLWMQYYTVNSGNIIDYRHNKISLCRVNDTEESYFLVCSARSDMRPASDVALNVVRVDGSGNQIWSKKYYDAAMYNFTLVRDLPGDIAYSRDFDMYMITGWREQFAPALEDRLFVVGIDRNGNMMTKFKYLGFNTTHPFGEDMIYDRFTKTWAICFSHGATTFPGSPGVASGMGLIRVDVNLNVVLSKVYWIDDVLENYGQSISLSNNGNYVIGGMVNEGSPLFEGNPTLMKVDSKGNPLWYHRYNIDDNTDQYAFGHHCAVFNTTTTVKSLSEQYVIVEEQGNDMRVLRTDIGGYTCGMFDYDIHVDDIPPIEYITKCTNENVGATVPYPPLYSASLPGYRECTGTGETYRPTGIKNSNVNKRSLEFYPSVLTLKDAAIIMQNETGEIFNCSLIDLNGKIITTKNINEGKTTLDLNAGTTLVTGIYLIRIVDRNGNLYETKKIVITD